MNRKLTDYDMQRVTLLIDFLKIAKEGIAKPHDPTAVLSKIDNRAKQLDTDLEDLKNCCSNETTVRDAKDFKPYIYAALDDLAIIMGWDMYKYKQWTNS